jgi:hypothetical protein
MVYVKIYVHRIRIRKNICVNPNPNKNNSDPQHCFEPIFASWKKNPTVNFFLLCSWVANALLLLRSVWSFCMATDFVSDMEDGRVGRSESSAYEEEDSMDAAGGDDDDVDDDATASSAAAAAATSTTRRRLELQPPSPDYLSGQAGAVRSGQPHSSEAALRAAKPPVEQQRQQPSRLGVVLTSSCSSTVMLSSSSGGSSSSSSSLALSASRIISNKLLCDTDDPKPGPSNSAADFDLEVPSVISQV